MASGAQHGAAVGAPHPPRAGLLDLAAGQGSGVLSNCPVMGGCSVSRWFSPKATPGSACPEPPRRRAAGRGWIRPGLVASWRGADGVAVVLAMRSTPGWPPSRRSAAWSMVGPACSTRAMRSWFAHPTRRRSCSRRSATLEPDSRRAIRRSTIGATTRPSTAQAPSTPMVSRCRQDPPSSTLAAPAPRTIWRTAHR
jgi:hypothetical protein